MDAFDQLQSDLIAAMGLSTPEATGFYACYCPMCGEKQRKTGGFKFEDGICAYHCFRGSCDATTVFEKDNYIPRKFRSLMETIGVKIPVELRVKKNSIQKQIEKELNSDLYEKNFYKEIEIPDGWEPLNRDKDFFWVDYMEERFCDPDQLFIIRSGPMRGLGAIPMYFYEKLVGFQIANPRGEVKYLNHSSGNKDLMLINGGFLKPNVIVTEGILDALSFIPGTVATLHHSVSPAQAYHLRGKNVILFPDRTGGNKFIDLMKPYGWKIVIPPWKKVKDLNDCVMRYGRVATARMIHDNTYEDPNKAKVAFGLWTGGN